MKKFLVQQSGFTIIEIMIVVLILSIMITGAFLTVSTGSDSWLSTGAQIDLEENVRATFSRISKELQESGEDSLGNLQVAISNGTEFNGSDDIRFTMPIICETGVALVDVNGDVANWGAPLTWGCTDSSCMDADDDCSSRDYAQIGYKLNVLNQLIRRVYDSGGNTVDEFLIAQNITDFQVALSGDQNIVTVTVTASKNSDKGRSFSVTRSLEILLRNKG